jgi:hypothetical protein
MSGKCWENTVLMTAAIAKGLTYTQNVGMQISIRVTNMDGATLPANYFIYDSRKNTLRELEVILGAFDPNGMTPEGLCFESMIKKNQLVRANADMDSYFLNISDGGPGGVGCLAAAPPLPRLAAIGYRLSCSWSAIDYSGYRQEERRRECV